MKLGQVRSGLPLSQRFDFVNDGKGPVAHWMRRSFAVRGGAGTGGVQAALRSYLAELATLRQTLDTVVTMHQGNDEEAAAALPAGDVDA